MDKIMRKEITLSSNNLFLSIIDDDWKRRIVSQQYLLMPHVK